MTGNIKSGLTDDELINKYLEHKNMQFYSVLYDRYAKKVYAKCISLLKSESLAEDATQEIFIKILLNLAKFSGRSKFSTWVYSITYNFCIDSIRRRKKDKSVLVEDISNTYDQAEEIDDRLLMETQVSRLKVVLEKVPLGDKTILLMKYQDGMSIKEISEILDKSESAIKMKIKRAKQKFITVHNGIYQGQEV